MIGSAILFGLLSSSVATVNAKPIIDERFFQPRGSEVEKLFVKRAPNPSDPNFASNYPASYTPPPTSSLPAAWTQKLANITMPNVPVSVQNNGYPTYSNGKGTDPSICSFTYQCTAPDDLFNPPDGVFALSFDDGPGPASSSLYSFLGQNNISTSATHFMIGSNILGDPTTMQAAFNAGGHIAVHTWSHLYTTTLTNEQVLGELGWTMQIISDLTGGRVPMYWRPPYGDVDNRVRAIAKGVFGLETVVWNQDTGDWAIGTNNSQYTTPSVEAAMTAFLSGPKSPGILCLEHEIYDYEVGVFTAEYPVIKSNGWKLQTVADAFGKTWYQNVDGDSGNVIPMSVGADAVSISASATANATSTSASAASTTSSSATTTAASNKASNQAAEAAASTKASGAAGRRAEGGVVGGVVMGILAAWAML